MSNIFTTLSNILVALTPCSSQQAVILKEGYKKVVTGLILIVTIGVLFALTISLSSFGIAYYLLWQGFATVSVISALLCMNCLFILLCILLLKYNVEKPNNRNEQSNNDQSKVSSLRGIWSSFIDGFNSRT